MKYYVQDKKELASILEKSNEGDSIYINSIECLGNSVYDISELLDEAYNKKIHLSISDNIELNFAKENHQLESTIELLRGICDLQKKRVKQSVKKAREEGKAIGRKKLTSKDLPEVFLKNLNRFYSQNLNKGEFAKLCNCSRPTLDKWLRCVSSGD